MPVTEIIDQTKLNCNISDANYWGFFSICNLLLRLRDLYFQEKSLLPWEHADHGEISNWIARREKLWEDLEERKLEPIRVGEKVFDPFDLDGINHVLQGSGVLYGAGYGLLKKPNFFVSKIEEEKVVDGVHVYLLGEDLCRDLSPPFAFRQEDRVYVRLNVFASYLYQKSLELGSSHSLSHLRRAFEIAGINHEQPDKTSAIQGLARKLSDLLVWHELGEAKGKPGGEIWNVAIENSEDRLSEFRIRALGDMLADLSPEGTLVKILDSEEEIYAGFYTALMDDVRKHMYPEILEFYNCVKQGQFNVQSLIDRVQSKAMTQYDALEDVVKNSDPADLTGRIKGLTRDW